MDALAPFHPAVQAWFQHRFPGGPTDPQREGWPAIAAGEDTLIAAPTGSGKTLAAFLVCLDRLFREADQSGGLEAATQVVYVSPLKALATDIHENLRRPLTEIADLAAARGLRAPEVRLLAAIARLLVGAGDGRSRPDGTPACRVVDFGHRRALDLAIELPDSELEAVCSHEQWGEMLDKIAAHVREHKTTLVFVNTRRLAERVAHLLAERLGEDRVAAHHGSLSRERRQRPEARPRSGQLGALVA